MLASNLLLLVARKKVHKAAGIIKSQIEKAIKNVMTLM